MLPSNCSSGPLKQDTFYEFTRTMQSYSTVISENTTLVLSTNSDLFKFLNGIEGSLNNSFENNE